MAAFEDDEDDDYYFVVAGTAYEEDNDGGFAIAASSEEEDDDYIKVITTFVPPPLPLPSSPSSSSHVSAAAAIASVLPAAPYADDAEEQEQVIDPSPSPPAAAYCANDVVDLHDAALRQRDGGMAVDIDDMTQAPTTPVVVRYYRPGKWDVLKTMDCGDGDGEVIDDDDEEDENEDDYRYQGYYDLADRGRARHVKRSSGRRGRTKKASTMGRLRGDVRQAHCSVNL